MDFIRLFTWVLADFLVLVQVVLVTEMQHVVEAKNYSKFLLDEEKLLARAEILVKFESLAENQPK
jgi:hypothetical protein